MAITGYTYTPVPEVIHDKVKSYAAFKHIRVPEAYEILVTAGLDALNFKLKDAG